MSDDLKNKGAQDRLRINVNEDHELTYWTKELNCTADELRAAACRTPCQAPRHWSWARGGLADPARR